MTVAAHRDLIRRWLTIADGRIAESWGELDFAGLWRQLNEPRPTN